MVTPGRGAWTKAGKANGTSSYAYIFGTTPDGQEPDKGPAYQAVNFAVQAIQARGLVFKPPVSIVPTGIFGPNSKVVVQHMQRALDAERTGDVKIVDDGAFGPITSRAAWRPIITWFAGMYHVPPEHMWGMISLESSFDPGAVGMNGWDSGLCQINLSPEGHGGQVTQAQAFDPLFAIPWSTGRLAGGRAQFSGKGADLQVVCSIAQHNSPAAALAWYNAGAEPVGQYPTIGTYVERVLERAATY